MRHFLQIFIFFFTLFVHTNSLSANEALINAILANPHDDLPRLVFADWIQENDIDPIYAEFIRLCIDVDRVGVPTSYEERRIYEASRARLNVLYRELNKDLSKPWRRFILPGSEFNDNLLRLMPRGFVRGDYGDSQPILRQVEFAERRFSMMAVPIRPRS